MEEIQELHQKLTDCLSTVKLGVAGRFVYFDKNITTPQSLEGTFILAVHATSPKETEEAGNIALEAIRDTIFPEIVEAGFGFACKQI